MDKNTLTNHSNHVWTNKNRAKKIDLELDYRLLLKKTERGTLDNSRDKPSLLTGKRLSLRDLIRVDLIVGMFDFNEIIPILFSLIVEKDARDLK